MVIFNSAVLWSGLVVTIFDVGLMLLLVGLWSQPKVTMNRRSLIPGALILVRHTQSFKYLFLLEQSYQGKGQVID